MTLQEFAKALLYYGLEAIGKYYSSYRGYVVDNDDPENLGRIQVIIPTLTNELTHVKWAWPKNQFAGNNYGIQLLPVKGDVVWVEFENGNARFPLWTHGHYGTGEKPEEFASPQVYGFKSPKGQIIIIDDRDGVEKIIINQGDNAGLVDVIPLTEKLNNIETKVNAHLDHYKKHIHIDPISGYTGVLTPPMGSPDMVTPVPIPLVETQQTEIEDTKVLH
jgi:hypothetical protein